VVPAQWLDQSSALSARVSARLNGALSALAQPERVQRLRRVLLVLLAIWAVMALTRLLWALVPAAEPAVAQAPRIINPLSDTRDRTDAAPVDIERMVAWHLFGKPGATAPAAAAPEAAAPASARAGIEQGARETRLQLKLMGIVASTEDGLGYAIIENNNQQAVYAVEDKLPAPGKVILAKVMPRQVVLDNGGTYELLVLYDDSSLGTPAAGPAPAAAPAPAASAQIDKRDDPQTSALAQSYRERLFQNPQSLVDVVNISAAREGTTLLGYKVNPGKDQEQFEQLGFKAGDLVTSVNGINLDNPANTMELFNAMRTANEAVFELQRDGQPLTLSVNLGGGETQ
jgi:general secretion pathway protein C